MLVLSRREGEEIIISGNIRVVVLACEGGRVPAPRLLAVPAPTEMVI